MVKLCRSPTGNTTLDAHLLLSDGTHLTGKLVGAPGEVIGEVVFCTSMTGYQEVLSDPSYRGQIVLFTYPMIGNYGLNNDDFESAEIQVSSIIVKQACTNPSNWRSLHTLDSFLKSKGMTSIEGIDTRQVTKLIRSEGSMMGMITTNFDGARERLDSAQRYTEQEFVQTVSTKEPYSWGYEGKAEIGAESEGYKASVALLDCGVKYSIMRRMISLGIQTKVFPYDTSADELLSHNPAGVILSPGPGDPAKLDGVVKTAKELLGKKPILGICLGNQILAQAIGASTYKLKFGHRGSNHPVLDKRDGTVTITSQNHGYAVDPNSLVGKNIEITQINLNDETVEGLAIKELRAESIQYHPEAAPGPWDSRKYFNNFVKQILQS